MRLNARILGLSALLCAGLLVASCSSTAATLTSAGVSMSRTLEVQSSTSKEPVSHDGVPVLGWRHILRQPATWGTVRPKYVSWEGSPGLSVLRIHWHHWGSRVAVGAPGSIPVHRPGGGYFRRPARAELRAVDLGMCHGKPAYRRLYLRHARRPGSKKLGPWRPWGTGGTSDICPSRPRS